MQRVYKQLVAQTNDELKVYSILYAHPGLQRTRAIMERTMNILEPN
jgi:hypothetical protein